MGAEAVIDIAPLTTLEIVDKFLAEISHVNLVPQSSVIDFALDLRKTLISPS